MKLSDLSTLMNLNNKRMKYVATRRRIELGYMDVMVDKDYVADDLVKTRLIPEAILYYDSVIAAVDNQLKELGVEPDETN